MPIFFVANHDQAPGRVRFMAKGSGLTAFFATDEVVLRVGRRGVRMRFDGANRDVRIEGRDTLPGHANFLIGPEGNWRAGVPLYGAIAYRGLYPGIDMIYGGDARQLKSEFIVQPGADPARIQVRYLGAGKPRLDDGVLVIPVGGEEVREQQPLIYQEVGGRRVLIEGRFIINRDGRVGFSVGEYERGRPLVIDPLISYSTLLGGSGADAATAIAVDSTGAAYVTGFTDSYNFPTANAVQNASGGGNDVFIAKISPAGNTLIYCTYLGGRADDRAYGIAVDSSGAVYVTGATTSTNFPIHNALQQRLTGAKNAFIAKLSPSGNSLVYSTYLGGGGSDAGNGIAVDAAGSAYIVGDTTSLTLPANGFQHGNNGSQDAFVAKLSSTGASLVYCTYLGGNNIERGTAIALDAAGSAYVTGSTYSLDFPTMNPFQASNAGGEDVFIAKLSANGSALLYSTYLGGSKGGVGFPEAGQGIAVDAQGNAYITGVTSSANFPVVHPLQSSLGGWMDAFVARFNSAGGLSYSTYLGGLGVDIGNAIAVDAGGMMYVVGYTYSTDLPMTKAIQGRNAGDCDAFLAKLSAAGDTVVMMDYLGGAGSDTATALALDGFGGMYLAGWTQSNNFPLRNGFQMVNSGNYGAFVAKLLISAPPVPVSVAPSNGFGANQTFSFTFSDPDGYADIDVAQIVINSSLSGDNSCYFWYGRSSNLIYLRSDANSGWVGPVSPGSSGTAQNSQCSLNAAASSVSGSGVTLTLNLALTFQGAFAGTQNVYMYVQDNSSVNSGWQTRGTWTVPPSGNIAPSSVSVSPSSGSGASQTFSFTFSDPNGYADLDIAQVVINGSFSGSNSCYFWYARSSNLIYLRTDSNGGWLGPVSLGSSATLQNGQCLLNAASSFSGSGVALTLNLALTFQSTFAGTKNVYMYVQDAASTNSGWQTRGTWTVPSAGNSAPSSVSVSPPSGTGTSQTFSFAFSDPDGYADLDVVQIVINGSLTGANTCYLWYSRPSNVIYLRNDANSGWIGPVSPSTVGNVQNSQCSLNAAASSSSGSGATLTLNLALTFLTHFAGAKNVYMYVQDIAAANAGWQMRGTWTVP